MPHARRAKRLVAATLATLVLIGLPATALAKIGADGTACTISSGSASLTVAWKGRDPDNVLAQYDAGAGQVNDAYALSSGDKAANQLTMPLSAVPVTSVLVRFQTSANRVFDSATVTCTGA